MGIVRNIAGTSAGIVASQVVVIAAEMASTALYPPPSDLAGFDAAQIAGWMESIPLSAKLLVVVGWAFAALAGAWIALRVTDRRWSGWLVTGIFVATIAFNLADLPHPLWMGICAIILPVLGGWLAQRLHRKPYPGEPLLG